MQCKSLWIKASAKCINVNVNVNDELIKAALSLEYNVVECCVLSQFTSVVQIYYKREP